MSQAFANALPGVNHFDQDLKRTTQTTADETTPGGHDAVQWIEIASNLSPIEATLIKGRLEVEMIPALIQQESIGAVMGLTVGPLSAATVLVPDILADQALKILADSADA